jgi:PEP-CTERM/exosortase A-associated glycosyltransferase
MDLKVLHLLDHSAPLHSGYTFRSLAILRSQRDLGIETVHVTSQRQGISEAEHEVSEGIEFFRTPISAKKSIPFITEIQAAAKRVEHLARMHKVDVIHAHSPLLHGISAHLASKRTGIPFVYEIRAFWEDAAVDLGKTHEGSIRYKATRAAETWVCNKSSHVFAICSGLCNDLQNRGIHQSKITLISNAVEAHKFEPVTKDVVFRRSLGIDDGDFVFGFFGSFYKYEGLEYLCRAIPLLAKSYPNFKVLLAGGGESETEIANLRLDPVIGKHLIYNGRVPNSEIQKYYGISDAMIYPRLSSRLTELTTPLKPLEAMAMKKLVLGTDIGGHRELIVNNETGILFEDRSEKACANAMLRAINMQSDELEKFHERASYFVRVERTWASVASRYIPIYTALKNRS